MEVVFKISWLQNLFVSKRKILTVIFITLFTVLAHSQPENKNYYIRDGKIHISLPKNIEREKLLTISQKYNLSDLSLQKFINENFVDSILSKGWQIEINNKDFFILSKPLFGSSDIDNPVNSLNISNKTSIDDDNLYATFGYNQFKKKDFVVEDSFVTFRLYGQKNAQKVLLAGSFTHWQYKALPMLKDGDEWLVKVKLGSGKHLYKFIVDGNWITDDNNKLTEDDTRGNINSVYFKTNFTFKLNGYLNEKKIIVAGSFNNWNEDDLRMTKNSQSWQVPVYLNQGTYTYRYKIGKNWIADPNNKDYLPNEFGETNSLISIGKTISIKLNGFNDAKKVFLMGSFNDWRSFELPMKKTSNGWQINYAVADGNYEYKFIVDGQQYNDDGEKLNNDEPGNVLVKNPNHQFILKGFENAKNISISGDFNNWSKSGYSLQKKGNNWSINLHLNKGKHLYKYIVDGKWIIDPQNKLWEENEYNTGNSVLWIE